jgi:hypothetical protein
VLGIRERVGGDEWVLGCVAKNHLLLQLIFKISRKVDGPETDGEAEEGGLRLGAL